MAILSAEQITAMHDGLTEVWHQEPDAPPRTDDDFLRLVAEQHRANFDLWHTEDEARRPSASDAEIAAVKRRVDKLNQRRNDLAEQVDQRLWEWVAAQGAAPDGAELSSESPGLMVDRLSILALKIYHTREQVERTDAPQGHAERNAARLAVLAEQRGDLAACLDALWRGVLKGTRRFKIYRQMKMYNDAELNPAVYGASKQLN